MRCLSSSESSYPVFVIPSVECFVMDDLNSSDEVFHDGHKVRGIEAPTKLARNINKASRHFVSIFDGLLDDGWSKRAYEYSASKSKPWGKHYTSPTTQPKRCGWSCTLQLMTPSQMMPPYLMLVKGCTFLLAMSLMRIYWSKTSGKWTQREL